MEWVLSRSCCLVASGVFCFKMFFSILSWNVRGLGRLEKRLQVKDIVNSSSVEIVVLIESKLKSIPRAFMHQVCPFPLIDGICLPSTGSAGGIWVMWDTSMIEILQTMVKAFSVSIRGHLKNLREEWLITGVYGPCSANKIHDFFKELLDVRNAWEGPWCLCGDFYEVLCLEDRPGDRLSSGGMNLFVDLVAQHGLRDVLIAGTNFTWSNMQVNPSLSRLDRFFLSPEWDLSFLFSKGLVRPHLISDHTPIVLCGKL